MKPISVRRLFPTHIDLRLTVDLLAGYYMSHSRYLSIGRCRIWMRNSAVCGRYTASIPHAYKQDLHAYHSRAHGNRPWVYTRLGCGNEPTEFIRYGLILTEPRVVELISTTSEMAVWAERKIERSVPKIGRAGTDRWSGVAENVGAAAEIWGAETERRLD